MEARQCYHRVANAANAENQDWLSERARKLPNRGPHFEPAILATVLLGRSRIVALRIELLSDELRPAAQTARLDLTEFLTPFPYRRDEPSLLS